MTLYVIRRANAGDADSISDLLQDLNTFHALEGMPSEAVRAQVRRQLSLCLADDSHSLSPEPPQGDEKHFSYGRILYNRPPAPRR